ncbi:barstar family protein [Streptomyces sp. NBC_00140]|uniref:barstar family protein n=1 Tax=Streptomyces sp. NBC_00140 TaxID=2975664 RepID=UPI0022594D02|nr:barstar family protein [Streptomyces sp. NBC_00140]MCX5329287.1 barstar family protein [Streptomyces sp. NBC_00140]
MRGAEHAVWERDFPVRYLLVQEDADGEEQYWGRCAGVEGMFVDKAPPPREVLTLRGCTPEGPLRDALLSDGTGTGLLGDLCVEVWDEEQPLQWWTLVDTVVLAHRPHRSDPALVDVVVGAGVEEENAWEHTRPAQPVFKVFAGTTAGTTPAGQCLDVEGLFASRCGRGPVPMHLVGCEPAEPLRTVLSRRRKWDRDWVGLWALDRHGRVMHRHNVDLRIEKSRPSVLGTDLLDITLTDGGDQRPLVARPIWETWYRGVPSVRNQWAPYTTEGRYEWLELTATGVGERRPDLSGGVHRLDGRFVTDEPGLHCAMAEALVGPGGYFGREWNAFRDCLGGGFGIAAPFTLIWHDSHIARQAFTDDMSGEGLTYFEEIVQLLERRGATVELH